MAAMLVAAMLVAAMLVPQIGLLRICSNFEFVLKPDDTKTCYSLLEQKIVTAMISYLDNICCHQAHD